MAKQQEAPFTEADDNDFARPLGPWTDRVAYSGSGGFVFRPREILVRGADNLRAAAELILDQTSARPIAVPVFDGTWILRSRPDFDFDVEYVVAELREQGLTVEPNHVLFAHSGGPSAHHGSHCNCYGAATGAGANPLFANPLFANALGANPLFANSVGANPLFANPLFANPLFANPLFANPLFANPLFANPLFANEYRTSGVRPSSAIPAEAPEIAAITLTAEATRAFIFDTGIASPTDLPPLLELPNHETADAVDHDPPDEAGDGFLDPASGHGTFIAGLLEQLAPGQDVTVLGVLTTFGDGDVGAIARRLDLLRTSGQLDDKTIINMSFGGYADDDMPTLATAIRRAQHAGAVVVASAGNEGTCRPAFPACLPGVVSVGSVEPHGPAAYSNHGPWVRACAPGSNVVSAFYKHFDGLVPEIVAPESPDPDEFNEWAQWTGTSFAAPIVAAALLRHIALTGVTAKQAVEHIIDAPGLLRLNGLGTVVNVVPPRSLPDS